MQIQTIADLGFKPRFSGHETFPFRYDWMRKLLSGSNLASADTDDLGPIERQMVEFGVGKNMVHSMHHWVQVAGAAEIKAQGPELTPFGEVILLRADPYLESVATIWALHWRIATNARLAMTWFWLFNLYPSSTISVRHAADDLEKYAYSQGWKVPSINTLRRDVECFLRCYAVDRGRKGELTEDSIECPLAELELLRPTNERGTYEFHKGPKPTLPDEVFIFALDDFWEQIGATETLSFDKIAHAPGSPGRVFKLDDNSLAARLESLEQISEGAFQWSDTAGLQQVTRRSAINDPLSLLMRTCGGRG